MGKTAALKGWDAIPVGLLVWGIGLSLGGTTGYAINPARARAIADSRQGRLGLGLRLDSDRRAADRGARRSAPAHDTV